MNARGNVLKMLSGFVLFTLNQGAEVVAFLLSSFKPVIAFAAEPVHLPRYRSRHSDSAGVASQLATREAA